VAFIRTKTPHRSPREAGRCLTARSYGSCHRHSNLLMSRSRVSGPDANTSTVIGSSLISDDAPVPGASHAPRIESAPASGPAFVRSISFRGPFGAFMVESPNGSRSASSCPSKSLSSSSCWS